MSQQDSGAHILDVNVGIPDVDETSLVKEDRFEIAKKILNTAKEHGIDGNDVAPQIIVDAVILHNAPLCGLSALMTTTVSSMEKTVKLLKENAPWCKVVVGGAVLNKEYADKMGADYYAKDAMSTVRYSEKIIDLSGE